MDKVRDYDYFQYKLLNNQYELGEKLEEGGYSAVFYALDQAKSPKAVKIINLNLVGESQKMINSLHQEDNAMRSIDSNQVIKCEESKVDKTTGYKFIVMELCSYFNLWHLIVFKGHLKEIQAKIYIKNILAGLMTMHHSGYSHRDIKSSNICLRNGHCVIIDLGCSKKFVNTIEGEQFNKTIKKYATIAGTVINKSPEMLSLKQYSYRTDFWGIGILFYEMLTGVTPFNLTEDDEDGSALAKIKDNISSIYNEDYIKARIDEEGKFLESSSFASRACHKISQEARQFLSKLITLNPDDRFNEEEMKNCKYLMEDMEIKDIWAAAQCVIPLHDIKWSKFVQEISMNKNLPQQKQPLARLQQQTSAMVIQKLSRERSLALKQSYNGTIQKDIENLNQIRRNHFQIKRMQLLIKLRQQLKGINHQLLHLEPIIFHLTVYCNKKLSIIQGKSYKENIGIFANKISSKFDTSFLALYLNSLYVEDEKDYENWLQNIKKNKDKKEKQKMETNEIQQECKKLLKQTKQIPLRLSKDAVCFLNYNKQILEFNYEPDKECYQWVTWSSLERIVIKSKEQAKKAKK